MIQLSGADGHVHQEIERKFLVRGNPWTGMTGTLIRQAYLMRDRDRILRIRQKGRRFFLTLKIGEGMSRFEYEQEVDDMEGEALLNLQALEPPLQKMRYLVPVGQHQWEIDVFSADNAGLVMAEVELSHVDETYVRPDWAAVEVTNDPRFQNSYLAQNPFKTWG